MAERQPTPTQLMHEWLEELISTARAGELVSTSAGAGRGRNYGYLHFRTRDGQHSVLVFRSPGDDPPELLAFHGEAEQDDVAKVVDELTHG